MHRLDLQSEADMMALRDRVKALLEEYHPAGYSNILAADVEVEIVEHAGEPNAEVTG